MEIEIYTAPKIIYKTVQRRTTDKHQSKHNVEGKTIGTYENEGDVIFISGGVVARMGCNASDATVLF